MTIPEAQIDSRVMTDTDCERLVGDMVAHLGNAQKHIHRRQAALFFTCDPDFGRRVTKGLGLDVKQVERLAAMSQEERAKATAG